MAKPKTYPCTPEGVNLPPELHGRDWVGGWTAAQYSLDLDCPLLLCKSGKATPIEYSVALDLLRGGADTGMVTIIAALVDRRPLYKACASTAGNTGYGYTLEGAVRALLRKCRPTPAASDVMVFRRADEETEHGRWWFPAAREVKASLVREAHKAARQQTLDLG